MDKCPGLSLCSLWSLAWALAKEKRREEAIKLWRLWLPEYTLELEEWSDVIYYCF